MSEAASARAVPVNVGFARAATYVVFATHALLFASWTAHIPLVKASLGLTDGELGFALFGTPIGSVLAMLATTWLLPRIGSKRMVQISLVGYCATAWTVGVAGSAPALFAALLVWGIFHGALDVSMNAQAVFVERAVGKPVMSGFHAAWSIGTFTGVGLGAVAVAAGVALAPQLLVLGVLGLLAAGTASRAMVQDPPHGVETTVDPRSARVWRNPVILMLGAIALACMLCEGAAADWSAVYLHDSLGAAAGFAALAYAAYSAATVLVRLTGDRLLAMSDPRAVLPALAIVATIGMSATLLVGSPAFALVGFASLGLGVALVIPAAFTAAGRLPGVHAGSAVAAVAAIGRIGYVAGPPVLGHLADAVTMPVALWLLPILTLGIAVVVRTSRIFTSGPALSVLEPADLLG